MRKIMRKSKYEVRDWFEDRGYNPLGNGIYSVVYAHPKNKDIAVKVGSGDKWPDYIAWATKKGYAGTFAPKVYSLKHYGDFYIATMERLAGTFGDMYRHCALPTHLEDIKNVLDYPEHHGKIKGEYSNRAKFGTLAAFARDLRKANFAHDMHNGNVMLRKDGHPVITDPAPFGRSSRPRIKRGTVTNYAN